MNKKFRLKKLEQVKPPEKVVIVVDWTPAGEEQEHLPGVTYVTWADVGEEGENNEQK